MDSRQFHIAILVWLICVFPLPALAETVVLKTGEKLNVEKVWVEKDQICFILHGMKASVPEKEVKQIDGNATLQGIASPKSQEETRIPAKAPSSFISNGFRDLQWGDSVSAVAGMQPLGTDTDLAGVIEYVRPADILSIDGTPLLSIIYAFWQDQLYTVIIWTQGYPNFSALREMVFEQFGRGRLSNHSSERYLWTETSTDMMLEYIRSSEKGLFWLRSCELDRKYKLSRISSHTSVLKWMNSRK